MFQDACMENAALDLSPNIKVGLGNAEKRHLGPLEMCMQ